MGRMRKVHRVVKEYNIRELSPPGVYVSVPAQLTLIPKENKVELMEAEMDNLQEVLEEAAAAYHDTVWLEIRPTSGGRPLYEFTDDQLEPLYERIRSFGIDCVVVLVGGRKPFDFNRR